MPSLDDLLPDSERRGKRFVIVFLGLVAFALLTHGGLITRETFAFGSFGIPALAIGALVGGRLSSRLDARVFRTIVYLLLLVLGARFLIRAL